MEGGDNLQIGHCSKCACQMDISALGPYTNVICPNCGHQTRFKCELDQYLLTKRHAAGGMSMVFVAQDTTLEREVAIKVLNETYSGDEVRMQQFQKEARITAALSHAHIVKVFTVGIAHGAYYIAMEMVSGQNLEQRMADEGAMKELEILPIAAEIIAGLRAAKQAGLIHRDVKPGNILFDASGHVKIVDFGLALVTQGGTAKAEEIWATPYYVPPEALDGLEEDFRSDIYALGATLYHALSGEPPISDESKSIADVRKAKESILPLAVVAPELHPETCNFVDKAMALRPEQRFSSYQKMQQACSRAQALLIGVVEPEEIEQEVSRRKRKRFRDSVLSIVALGGVILFLVAGGLYLTLKKINDNQDDALLQATG